MVRPGEQVHEPGSIIVNVAEIAGAADDGASSVPNSHVVIKVQPTGRHSPFHQRADEMHGNEFAAKLYHLRPADGGLQPLAVVKLGVPVVDGGVIAAEGDLEVVILLKPDNAALHF